MAVMRQEGQTTAVDVARAAAGSTMRAVVQDRYGSAAVLRLATIARPEVADHEVLIRVQAAGLDRGVWHLLAGQPYLSAWRSGSADPATGRPPPISPAPSSRSVRL